MYIGFLRNATIVFAAWFADILWRLLHGKGEGKFVRVCEKFWWSNSRRTQNIYRFPFPTNCMYFEADGQGYDPFQPLSSTHSLVYALITYSNALVLDYLTETIQLTLVFRLGSKRDTNRNEACEHHHVVGWDVLIRTWSWCLAQRE